MHNSRSAVEPNVEGKTMTDSPPGLVMRNLLNCGAMLKDEHGWEPFRPGVHIRRLYDTGDNGPAAAVLRYQPVVRTPLHTHLGYEHILVLEGEQSDERGQYFAGTVVINPPGSSHTVSSEAGCVVLIIWERGVSFVAC